MTDIKSNASAVLKDLQERIGFVLNADKTVIELLEILKETHTVLVRLVDSTNNIETTIEKLEANFDVDEVTKRVERLETAVLNIERGTAKVEAALDSLPARAKRAMARHRYRQD